MNVSAEARQALVANLRREVGRLEMGRPPADEQPVSTGSPALDRLLPLGGLRRGTLVEYLATSPGCGAGTLALAAAREACGDARTLVVVDQPSQARSASKGCRFGHFYPPAAAAWGIDLTRLLVLRPASEADALWALDQALRCSGVGAVWAAWDEFDVRDFRRLQLAAECGGTLGLLLRPARHRSQPTWADVRWEVSPKSKVEGRSRRVHQRSAMHLSQKAAKVHFMHPTWRLQVELVRCHGTAGGQAVLIEFDETPGIWREVTNHATHSLPLPAQLADPAGARRA